MITLTPSETRKCANVTNIDDKIVERMETFDKIVLPAMQINGTINIADSNGELMWNNLGRKLSVTSHIYTVH